jgi:hypothetical protein
MEYLKNISVDSPFGTSAIDSTGSAVGVIRMDPKRSYAGVGEFLQEVINSSDREAWEKIKSKIDYTFENLDMALAPLAKETGFSREIQSRVTTGQKLLFKPNLVFPMNIDPLTHGPGMGSTACTEWPFLAALMRWFHDKVGISYHQMAVGEAATGTFSAAGRFSMSNAEGRQVTTEAVIEGKSGDFYGGWGFYFARKYLAESMKPGAKDDPMKGYEESVAGTYIPPGQVTDKLMVYDLNRIADDTNRGRIIEVPDGVNFKSITLHKVVVGGDPDDPDDMKAYPGCVLVNLPKLKVHGITIFTNVIKNLGIGLYPMQSANNGGFKWEYSFPHWEMPGIKGNVPHQVWVQEMNPETGLPRRDAKGQYIVKKTGGILATMVDIIKAVSSQDIFTIHIVDAIEAINLEHQGIGIGTKEAEGLVFAGVDAVATDLLSARYMFSNTPLGEALKVDMDDGQGGRFLQQVPVPTVDGNHIVTKAGHDCPLSRDISFQYAEERGLGKRSYYVVGRDVETDSPLVSLKGHLGYVANGKFSDLTTDTLYYDVFKLPWDLQRTAFAYMESVDQLTGSSLKETFLKAHDENGDGVVTYEEFGKKGAYGPLLFQVGTNISIAGMEKLGYLRGPFTSGAIRLKWSNAGWNRDGHHLLEEFLFRATCLTAYRMSQRETETQDPFLPSLTWGKGKWPSYQLAAHMYIGISIYGGYFPTEVGLPSLYGLAFCYADLTQNDGRYTGNGAGHPNPAAIHRYFSKLKRNDAKPLSFTIYVPSGYDNLLGTKVPNVEVTDDPGRILTASFADGEEVWAEFQPFEKHA